MMFISTPGGGAYPIPDTRKAMDKLEDDLDASRRRRFGPDWYKLDWYGRPIEPKPPMAPRNYPGIDFLDGMARKIVKHSII